MSPFDTSDVDDDNPDEVALDTVADMKAFTLALRESARQSIATYARTYAPGATSLTISIDDVHKLVDMISSIAATDLHDFPIDLGKVDSGLLLEVVDRGVS
jgi:hypothetical protein